MRSGSLSDRSSNVTFRPCLPRATARAHPAIPAPIMRTSDSLYNFWGFVLSSLLTAMTGMEGCGCLAPGMDVAVVAAVVMEGLDMATTGLKEKEKGN